jgi:hypothetical protein
MMMKLTANRRRQATAQLRLQLRVATTTMTVMVAQLLRPLILHQQQAQPQMGQR